MDELKTTVTVCVAYASDHGSESAESDESTSRSKLTRTTMGTTTAHRTMGMQSCHISGHADQLALAVTAVTVSDIITGNAVLCLYIDDSSRVDTVPTRRPPYKHTYAG